MKRLVLIFLLLPCVLRGQVITTVAGNGTGPNNGDNGPALSAGISNPVGIAFDHKGNFYICTSYGHTIRKVDTAGIITTFAGTGNAGFSGDNGPAINADLSQPNYIAVDEYDNVYFSDAGNHRIRKVDTTGIITTFAGNGTGGYGGDNGPCLLASLYTPQGICFDNAGNLYIADYNNYRIRKIDTTGIITTVAGIGVLGYSGDGGPADSAKLRTPMGVAVDSSYNIYVADWGNNRIRKIDTSGIINTVVGSGVGGFGGDDSLATNAKLAGPFAVLVDDSLNLYIADNSNARIREVQAMTGIITTIVGTGVAGFSGDGGLADSAQIYLPEGLAFDRCGNLYISEVENKRVRKVAFNPDCSPIDTTTSVRKITTQNDLNLYPNPAQNELVITAGNEITAISIINTLGQRVLTQSCHATKAGIDISRLHAGVYFILVRGKDEERWMRFVKE